MATGYQEKKTTGEALLVNNVQENLLHIMGSPIIYVLGGGGDSYGGQVFLPLVRGAGFFGPPFREAGIFYALGRGARIFFAACFHQMCPKTLFSVFKGVKDSCSQ